MDENIKLKSNIQKLRTEVAYHRAEFMKVDQDLKQKEKLIEELLNIDRFNTQNGVRGNNLTNNADELLYTNPQNHFNGLSMSPDKYKSKEMYLIINLKRQFKEMKGELRQKDDEIERLKRQVKVTKLNEMQLENKTLGDELAKMKNMYDNAIMSHVMHDNNNKEFTMLQESFTRQQGLVASLQDHNTKLLEENKTKEEIVAKLKDKKLKMKAELKEKDNEIEILKRTLLDNPLYHGSGSDLGAGSSDNKDNDNNLNSKSNEQLKENIKFLERRALQLSKDVIYYKELSDKRQKMLKDLEDHHLKTMNEEKEHYHDKMNELRNKVHELEQEIKEKEKEIHQLKENHHYKEVHQSREIHQHKEVHQLVENQNSLEEINTNINVENANYNEILVLSDEDFNDLSYILAKNLEAHKLGPNALQKLFDDLEDIIDTEAVIEKIVDKLLAMMKNKNKHNREQILAYLKTLVNINGSNISGLKEHFVGLYEGLTHYSEDNCAVLDPQLKKVIGPLRHQINNEIKKTVGNSPYISFLNLRKVLETLEIKLENDLIEYLIYTMKKFNDPNSSIHDLKYENANQIFNDEEDASAEELRRLSVASSQIIMNAQEYQRKSESILAKIGGHLYSINTTTRKFFADTFVLKEKNSFYNAMYLKLFLKVLHNELKLNLDATDSLCIFNRLKNNNNVYNIEVIDIDKLVEEMENYGIYEKIEENEVEPLNNPNEEGHSKREKANNLDYTENVENYENNLTLAENQIQAIEEVNNLEAEIDLIQEFKTYLKINKARTHFEKLIFLLQPKVLIQNERYVNMDDLVNYLYEKNVILSKNIYRAGLIAVLNDEDLVNINILKELVELSDLEQENDANRQKRLSKLLTDNVFHEVLESKNFLI